METTEITQLDRLYNNMRILRHFVRQGMVFYHRAKSGYFYYAFVVAPPRLDTQMDLFLDIDEIENQLTDTAWILDAFERQNENEEMYFTSLVVSFLNKASFTTFNEYNWPDNMSERAIRHTQLLEIEEAMKVVGQNSDPKMIAEAIESAYC